MASSPADGPDSFGCTKQRSNTQLSIIFTVTGAWERATDDYLKQPLLYGVTAVALWSARNPRRTVAGVVIISITLAVVGFLTNFRLVADGQELWAPVGTRTLQHAEWIEQHAGFNEQLENNKGYLAFLVHRHGHNVLTVTGANCLFDAVETIRGVPGYHQTCYESWGAEDQECPILSASALFGHNRSNLFSRLGDQKSDEIVQRSMSQLVYPSGEPVVRSVIFGHPEPTLPTSNTTAASSDTSLTAAAAYLGLIPKSETDDYDFELDATRALYKLQDIWDQEGIDCQVEANSFRALDDESQRGVEGDIPMMGLAFVIMGIVCALYLSNYKNLVQSRAILGVGAVITIAFSVMTSYGFLFLIGVPFTPVAQIFIYVMVGIGLDDTFIITGAYSRADPQKEVVERIRDCMEEVGISIVVSTLTTAVAFSLGCATSMPMIRWFCIYAAPTVLVDFFYQISFFIALVVLDDERVKDNRYDCLVCVKSKHVVVEPTQEEQTATSCTSNLMARYCDVLLRPQTKALVLLLFSLTWGLGIFGTTRQRQELDFRDMMPPDSFIRTYFGALHEYSSEYSYGLLFLRAKIYFRDVDVSSDDIQRQMNDYVNDLVQMPYISSPPEFFWLRDFSKFLEVTNGTAVAAMPFNDQLTLFLETPPFDVLYSKDIVRDSNGDVTASRCEVVFDQGSNYDVPVQMKTVREQRKVTSMQPINHGKSDWPFFMFTEHFFAWELHDLMASELLLTLILGLVSVFVISILFIPHPFWALVLPLIVGAVYCQLMAFLNLVGIYINVVTAIGLIMSIGLLVDYNMHVALTYHETKDATSRDERVRKVLTTMGASIFVGGVTTMTSALPLGLTASLAFQTFFFTFLAIPVLGIAHGLILLPVILSLWGPHEEPTSSEPSASKSGVSSTTCNDMLGSQISSSTGTEEVKDVAILQV